jgi:hypothetical protein
MMQEVEENTVYLWCRSSMEHKYYEINSATRCECPDCKTEMVRKIGVSEPQHADAN